MKDFEVKIVKIHPENPYVKVYAGVNKDMVALSSFLNQLQTVDHTNITSNQANTRESLVVYPMKTCSIEEVECDIKSHLLNY